MRFTILLSGFLLVLSGCSRDCKEKNAPGACACYALYAPVCGCNGETYENDCRAECAGIEEYTEGACR